MVLYHFCAAHAVPSILRDGLTFWMLPLYEPLGFTLEPNWQWLTTEKDPKKQSWTECNMAPYSRTAYRLTIRIPDSYRKKLIKATELVKSLREDQRHIVDDWAGSDSWYVFHGRIPPGWIIGKARCE